MRSCILPQMRIEDVETTVSWHTLDIPTARELADTNLVKAQTDAALISAGAISSEDARRRVATDPDGGYNELGLDEEPMPDDDEPGGNNPGGGPGTTPPAPNNSRVSEPVKNQGATENGAQPPKPEGQGGDAGQFNESDHPRADNGRFGKGSGGSGGSGGEGGEREGGKPRVVELTGKELGDFPDTPEGLKALRKAAVDHLRKMRDEIEADPSKAMDCPILGEKVSIRGRGIEEVKQFSANPDKLKLVAGIKSLIGNAYGKSWEDNYKKAEKPQIEGYYTLKSQASIGGKKMDVGILIEKDDSGHYHYDFLLDSPKTKTALDSAASAPYRMNGGLTNVSSTSKVGHWSMRDFAALDAESQGAFSINMLVEDAAPRAAGILYLTGGRVLLLKRADDAADYPGTWAFPAGHIEAGETPLQAALRESKEETGFAPESAQLLRQDGGFTLFLARIGKPFYAALNDESSGYLWALPDELPQPLHPGVREAVRQAVA